MMIRILLLAGLLIVFWGCLGTNKNPYYNAAPSAPSNNNTPLGPTSIGGIVVITIPAEANSLGSKAFGENPQTINVGTTVMWVNGDGMQHSVTSDAMLFDSGPIDQNSKFSFIFTVPGTYTYHCSIHPNMTGTIVVLGNAGYTPRF